MPLLLFGLAIAMPFGLAAYQSREIKSLRAGLAAERERSALMVRTLGNPYRLIVPLIHNCQHMNSSTANCLRFDYDGDGFVTIDDERIVMGLAQNSAEVWRELMERRISPENAVEELARQAEALLP